MPVCFSGLSYEFLLICSMSQAPQLPEQPATPCPSEQSAPPSASRVHGAFDAEFLHVFIGRYFRVDVVPLDHQREGHAQYEQPDGEYGAKQED